MVFLGLQLRVEECVAQGGLGLVGGVELREGWSTIAAGVVGSQSKVTCMEEETCIGGESCAEVVVLGVAYSHDGLKGATDGQLVLCEEVIGVGGLEVDVVTLTVEAFLDELGTGGELVPRGEAEDAAQGFVDVVGALAGFVVGLLFGGLPVGIFRDEVVAVNVEIDVDAGVRSPAGAATVEVGGVVEVVGVGDFGGVGVGDGGQTAVNRDRGGGRRGGGGMLYQQIAAKN